MSVASVKWNAANVDEKKKKNKSIYSTNRCV